MVGDLERADALLQPLDIEADGRLFMPLPVRFPLGLSKAEVALALGRDEEALVLSRSMTQELERLGLKFWLPRALFLQARARLALGDYYEGLTLLEAAVSAGEEMGASWTLRPVLELRNALRRSTGKREVG